MTTKLEVSGCYADENPSERPAQCADLSGSDGSSLREDSDRQGVALAKCESSEDSCSGLPQTLASDSWYACAGSTSPPHIEHIRAAMVNPQFNSDRPISGLPRTGVS